MNPSYHSNNSPPDSGRIRCVCEYDEDDGFTIQCEQCLVWQHAKCVGISKSSVPEQYFCEECNPVWHDDLHNMALQSIDIDSITSNTSINHLNNNSNINIIGGPGPALTSNSNSNNNSFHTTNGVKATGNGNLNINIIETVSPIKKKICVPFGVPAMNEISENIISHEAQPILDSFLSGLNIDRLERQQKSQGNSFNFEFQSTVVLDSPERMFQLQKSLEVREIRVRGYQKKGTSTKYGLYVLETCDPGHFIGEFIGHVQIKNLLTVKGAKEFPVTVSQSFVLYPLASVDMAVDARKFGNCLRYARRSCRPNVQIKPIIVLNNSFDDKKTPKLSWGLFSTNIIKANSEILLPLDYHCGNRLFRYECACNAPDFCLGPIENSFLVKEVKDAKETKYNRDREVQNSSVGPVSSVTPVSSTVRPNSPKPVTNESAELESLGIRRSSSVVLQEAHPSTSKDTRPILDTRKMSREERKLQKYIEYFEKMDSVDAAKKTTTSASSSAASIGSSRKGSSSGSSPGPPNHQTSSSHTSSPGKSTAGPKKAWKTLFTEDRYNERIEEEVFGEQERQPTTKTDGDLDSSVEPVVPVVKAKRGRKPGSKNQTSQSQQQQQSTEELNKIPSSPLATKTTSSSPSKVQTSPKSVPKASAKRSKKDVSIVDDEDEEENEENEIDVGSEVDEIAVKKRVKKDKTKTVIKEKEFKKRKLSKTEAKAEKLEKEKQQTQLYETLTSHEPVIVDIERSSSVVNVVENGNTSSNPALSSSTNLPPTTQPDTPSKKKLSLSDYLKKKKSSSPASGVISTLSFDDIIAETNEDSDKLFGINNQVVTNSSMELEMGEIGPTALVHSSSNNNNNFTSNQQHISDLREAIFGRSDSRSSIISRSSEIESEFERNDWSRERDSDLDRDFGRERGREAAERKYDHRYKDQYRAEQSKEQLKEPFRGYNNREQFREPARELPPMREYPGRDNNQLRDTFNEQQYYKEKSSYNYNEPAPKESYREQLRELYSEPHREPSYREPPREYPETHRAQMLQPPPSTNPNANASSTSRFRDDREREMDRLKREKEFERREAEREREKERRERMSMVPGGVGKEREVVREYHRGNVSDFVNYRPATTPASTYSVHPSNAYHQQPHELNHPHPHPHTHPYRERERERDYSREFPRPTPPQYRPAPHPYNAARHVNVNYNYPPDAEHMENPQHHPSHPPHPRPPHQRPHYRPNYRPYNNNNARH